MSLLMIDQGQWIYQHREEIVFDFHHEIERQRDVHLDNIESKMSIERD